MWNGRSALTYQGLMDGNNALVPTRRGLAGPVKGSEERSFTHIAADVHFEAGVECIDCPTSRETMGDGFAHANMEGQLEIRCEDCHGDAKRPPRFVEVTRESDAPVRESRQYAHPVSPGTRMALTGKGRPYANVFESKGQVVLAIKRTGRLLRSPVITGTPAHTIAGHGRLECSACHSRAVPQCFGCHTSYDKRVSNWDVIKDEDSPGEFGETEDTRTLPDVRFERGMSCADCHTMKSLQEGKRAAMGCRDCHSPAASASPEHAIAGHLEKLSAAGPSPAAAATTTGAASSSSGTPTGSIRWRETVCRSGRTGTATGRPSSTARSFRPDATNG